MFGDIGDWRGRARLRQRLGSRYSSSQTVIDDDGAWRVDRLAPGAEYSVRVWSSPGHRGGARTTFTAQPDETVDVGPVELRTGYDLMGLLVSLPGSIIVPCAMMGLLAGWSEENIFRGHARTLMPAWGADAGGLTDDAIDKIVDLILSTPFDAANRLPRDVVVAAQSDAGYATGDAGRGRAAFTKHCAACHGADGAGGLAPSLNNPVFQEAATAGFINATIAFGRRHTPMPGFLGEGGLDESTIQDLVAHVRSLGTSASNTSSSLTGASPSDARHAEARP